MKKDLNRVSWSMPTAADADHRQGAMAGGMV
jgi:hypothetical protein